MLSDPGHIASNAALSVARPCIKVEIYWDAGWVDESAYIISASGESELLPPHSTPFELGSGREAEARLLMSNTGHRYSEGYSGSQANTYGIYGKKIRISAGYYYGGTPEYVRIFTGRIVDAQDSETSGQAILTCHGLGSGYNRQQISTAMYTDKRVDEWIAILATAAGMTSSDYDLEKGLAIIPFLYMDDDNPVSEMRYAAASEGGICFWDVEGKLRFWNAAHWVGASSVATFDGSKYHELRPSRSYENTWNIVSVRYEPGIKGQAVRLTRNSEPVFVPPADSVTHHLTWQLPMVEFSSYVLRATSAGADLSGNISLNPTEPQYARSWNVEITNSNTRFGAWVWLDVYGYPLESRPSAEYKSDPDGVEGTISARRKEVKGNVYVQSEAQAELVADMLSERFSQVRVAVQSERMRANPLVELGDVITLSGTNTGINGTFVVTGIKWNYGNSYSMTLSAIDFSGWYPYSDYFVVGSSALGASGGRLFW